MYIPTFQQCNDSKVWHTHVTWTRKIMLIAFVGKSRHWSGWPDWENYRLSGDDCFNRIQKEPEILGLLLFHEEKINNYFVQTRVGQHFGRIFDWLIWSPWLLTYNRTFSFLQNKNFIYSHEAIMSLIQNVLAYQYKMYYLFKNSNWLYVYAAI
jgi:hypothetical protein